MHRNYGWVLFFVACFWLVQPWKTSPVQAGTFKNCASVTEIPTIECNALLALYNSTNGPAWTNNYNWFVTDTPSNWNGLYLANGHVTEIYLNFNNLSGSIPPEIGNLTNLLWLQLGFNNLSGNIPAQLGSLANLEDLYLQRNQLSGSLPAELGRLANLNSLSVAANQLTGLYPLSMQNLSKLTSFAGWGTWLCEPQDPGFQLWKSGVATFQSNGQCYSIQGKVSDAGSPIPGVAISDGKHYNTLTASDGNYQLSEVIPGQYQLTATLAGKTFSPSSHSVEVSGANITGADFRTFGPFSSCSQQTEIPASECNALVNFYTGTHGTAWTDHVNWMETDAPSNWSGVTVMGGHVTRLKLGSRSIRGSIPAELGNLSFLTILDLYGNQLSGKIPTQLSNLVNLQQLSLSYNRFIGSLPVSFTALTRLKIFTASNTFLCEPQDAGFQAWKATVTSFYSPGLCYSISGRVTDAGSPLAEVVISDPSSNSTSTGPDGSYTLSDLPPSFYTLSAALTGKTFSPPTHALNLSGANITGADFRTFGPFTTCALQTEIPEIECSALLALYNATGGPAWTTHTNWLETDSPGNWTGVSVLGGRVVRLDLSSRNLKGNIPPEISGLTRLETLNLSFNQLSGTIPSEVGSLVELKGLYLGSNTLVGRIPVSFTALTKLQRLNFPDDLVCIPHEPGLVDWFTNTLHWSLYYAGWCHTISGHITESTGGPVAGITLTYKYRISAVSGPDGSYTIADVPSSTSDASLQPTAPGRSFSPEVVSLKVPDADVSGQNFTASGPFKGCDQQAEVPALECGALVALYNQTNGAFWGHRDHWLETDTPGNWYGVRVTQGHVTRLYAPHNNMAGSLPEELGNLSELENLDLSGNDLRGNLPTSLVNLTRLTGLDLANNRLTGSFPAEIDRIPNLAYLNIFSNLFNGSLPLTLSNLAQLKNFDARLTHLCEPRDAAFQAWKTASSFLSPGLCVSVSGRVSQASGPLAGVTLSNGFFRSAQSAPDGTYTLTEMPPGYYTITPALSPYIFTPPSLMVSVEDADVTGKDFFGGQATYSISGRVLLNGAPLSNVTISSSLGPSATTQYDGSYTLPGLVPGSYTLTPSLYGHTFTPATLIVTVANANLGGQDFTATKQIHSISGRVFCGGSPVSGALVRDDHNLGSTYASWDGSYTLSGLFPGSYTLTTAVYRCSPYPLTRTVLLGDTDLTGIDFDGTWLTNSISGRVLLDGSPLAGVTVSSQNGISAASDANGTYVLPGFRSGSYLLTPSLQGTVFNPSAKWVQVYETDVTLDFQAYHPFTGCANQTEIPASECDALAALYNHTNGSYWGGSDDGFWLVNDQPGTWRGVTVTAGHVTRIALGYRSITGTIPAELGGLAFLQELDLAGNGFSGSLPPELGNLTQLTRLDLYGNGALSGGLPPEWGSLVNLTRLDVSQTRLVGRIPLAFTALPHLSYFSTSSSYLCEPRDASYQAWKAGIATVYSQGQCYSISGRVSDASGPLSGVAISNGTTLPGTTTAADGTYILENLPAGLSSYSGSYTITPTLIGKLFSPMSRTITRLESDLAGVDFRASGPFSSCDLQVEIPAAECNVLLAVYNGTGGATWNQRTRWLETDTPGNWYGITVSGGHVTGIDLHDNNLKGPIPAQLGSLTSLKSLVLYANQLSGTLPPELGSLSSLNDLFLYYNASLYGRIPLSFTSLTQLNIFESFGTGLCSPQDASFQAWKSALGSRWYPSPNPLCYSVSGKILKSDGSPVAGVVISINSSIQATSGPDGGYTFIDLPAGGQTLTPALSGQSFSPVSLTVTITNASLTGQNFLASSPFTGCAHQVEIPEPECAALVAIYNQTGGPGWQNRAHWLETDLPGNWFGVTLSNGHVNSLSLSGNHLVGSLPPEMGLLTMLQNLDLGMNTLLQGGLPAEIGQMANLKTIDFFNTELSGSVPRSMMSLTRISWVDLRVSYLCEPPDPAFQTWRAAVRYWDANGLCYTIRGSITQAGSPLPGVVVANGHGRSATSGANGAYAITEVPPETYTLTPALANTAFTPTFLNVSLINSDLSEKNFTAVPTAFSVSGQVMAGSSPLAGVTISDGQGHSTVSGADGGYTLGGLPNGNYTLTPSLAGYSFAQASLGITISNSNLSGKNFTASRVTYSISGVVLSGSGSPLTGVSISDGQGHSTLSGADGRYTLSGLLPGSYTLTPSRAGYSFYPASLAVPLTNANLTGMNFIGGLITYSISGQILAGGNPLACVTISDGQGQSALSGADGRYSLSGLLPGSYTLTPSLVGYSFSPSSLNVTLGNANLTGKDFSATLITSSISGQILAGGSPLMNVAITDGHGHSVLSGADGRYFFTGLVLGNYTLTPVLTGYTFAPAALSVTLSYASLSDQNFSGFATPFSVSGRVLYLEKPVAGATISDGHGHSTLSGSDGRYTLAGLAPGRYTLRVTLPGHSGPSAAIQVNVTTANLVDQEIRTGVQVFIPVLQH